jgi:hypothetical protein
MSGVYGTFIAVGLVFGFEAKFPQPVETRCRGGALTFRPPHLLYVVKFIMV